MSETQGELFTVYEDSDEDAGPVRLTALEDDDPIVLQESFGEEVPLPLEGWGKDPYAGDPQGVQLEFDALDLGEHEVKGDEIDTVDTEKNG